MVRWIRILEPVCPVRESRFTYVVWPDIHVSHNLSFTVFTALAQQSCTQLLTFFPDGPKKGKHNMKLFFILLLAGAMAGCIDPPARHIVTGQIRPSIAPGQVAIYPERPANSVEIAHITVRIKGPRQQHFDAAIENAKSECARLGANGFSLTGSQYFISRMRDIDGVAYFTP